VRGGSVNKIALHGFDWRPSYLVEISDFAPPSHDGFAFFNVVVEAGV
jgi:hypothetical protein